MYFVQIEDTNNFGGADLGNYSFDISAQSVPEPTSILSIIGITGIVAAMSRRQKSSK